MSLEVMQMRMNAISEDMFDKSRREFLLCEQTVGIESREHWFASEIYWDLAEIISNNMKIEHY